ncbi:MAG: cation transport regulator ChaB [Frankiales bacterium]|jgi:cation transport regulator ChaB|nr:cation transport regulator ChaB [Frankiales bacterium]
MPKTTRGGSAKQEELPATLKRSPEKAQRTFTKVHDAAAEEYGEGERAHRTAYAAVKHSFEKVGDHWEPKDHKGPSDAQDAKTGAAARESSTPTAGGVDANASKKHLYELAQRLDVPGRSSMSKDELVDALQKANAKATRDAH